MLNTAITFVSALVTNNFFETESNAEISEESSPPTWIVDLYWKSTEVSTTSVSGSDEFSGIIEVALSSFWQLNV